MDTGTYPDSRVADFVKRQVVPLRLRHDGQPLAGVFNIFLLRNFMKGIPKALDEAAYIDGASSLQVYRHVMLPSIKPVLIVVALFSFNGSWNDFLWPTIVMTDVRQQTLTAGLRLLMGQYEQKWAHLIASVLVSKFEG